MTVSFVAEAHGTTSTGNLTLTIPTGVQGQDILYVLASSSTTGITTPSGWTAVATNNPSTGFVEVLLQRVAAGSIGSASTDVGGTVVLSPASSGVHSGAALTAWRGVDTSNPLDDHDFVGSSTIAGGTTSFAGPTVTTTHDNCVIVSGFVAKGSVTINYTQPSGYTLRSSAVTSSGSGKADSLVASKGPVAAGNWGSDAWTTDATPGTYGVAVWALKPLTSSQTIYPTSDVGTASGVTGVGDAVNLYANLDETTPSFADYDEFIATGTYTTGLGTLSDPGTATGWTVGYSASFGTSTAGAVWQITLYQSSTSIETWTYTQTADNDVQTHALNPTNVANIGFPGGVATALRLKFVLTSVS